MLFHDGSLFPALCFVVVLGGCQPAHVARIETKPSATDLVPAVAVEQRVPTTPADPEPKPAEKAEGEDPRDYWKDVSFTLANFEELRAYVDTYYVEAPIDEARAWVEASNFALLEMDPPRQLVPVAFYEARKAEPDEDVLRRAKTYKLNPKSKYLVLEHREETAAEKAAKKEPKRLDDDEIRKLRADAAKRGKQLDSAWKKIAFGEAQFRNVLRHIEETEEKADTPSKKKVRSRDAMRPYYVAAANGYLHSLDPHSSLIPAAAWEEAMNQTTDGSFEGIGAVLTTRGERTLVETPLEGRPAHAAGLRAGDVIIRVDDEDITGMPLHKVVARIRGPRGKPVALRIERVGEPQPLTIVIVRAHIVVKNVTGRLVPHHEDVGYLKLTGFVPTSLDMLKAEFARLTAKAKGGKLRGLILDLRNNSGGLLDQGVKIADQFLHSGVVVSVKSRVRRDEVYPAFDTRGDWRMPVVVLVNDGTASASEIVASAIQDNSRGLVVGDRTFGKASVQTLFSPVLRKDYYIKLTVARYYSPSGRTIQVKGVTPDIQVPPEPNAKMPLGFREENLSHYLKPIEAEYRSPNKAIAQKVVKCGKQNDLAERLRAADPNPQIKFDYQLMKAADYLECYAKLARKR